MSNKEKAYVALELEEDDDLVDIGEEPEEKPVNGLLYKDGKYYWVAELPMLKTFALLFEVWRVLGISTFIIAIIGLVANLIGGNGPEAYLAVIGMCALVMGILMVLSIPAYYIVTKANNGKYTVLFEMDDEGVDHTQIKTDKAKALDILTMMAGSATKNYTLRGIGTLNASGGSLYSSFANVRKIRANKNKGIIALNGRFLRNQVYVDDENFDFVSQFIRERCPNAREI